MTNFHLTPSDPLGGYSQEFPGVAMREITGQAVVSLACKPQDIPALETAIKKAFAIDLPNPGQLSASKSHLIMAMAADQWLLIFQQGDDVTPAKSASQLLSGGFAVTDQSDSYASLQLTGPNCRRVLERICPIDLSDATFPKGSVARTAMDHLSVTIFRATNGDKFTLMSPRSSATAFLHAIEVSIRNAV